MSASKSCPSCGHPVAASESRCPECGTSIRPTFQAFAALQHVRDTTIVEPSPTFVVGRKDTDVHVHAHPPIHEATSQDTTEPALHRASPDAPEGLQPLIGQSRAIGTLRTAIEKTFSQGRTTITVVQGTAGSGRTRLLRYATQIATEIDRNSWHLSGAFRESETVSQYAPLDRVLLNCLGNTASNPSNLRAELTRFVARAFHGHDPTQVMETVHLLSHMIGLPFSDSPFLSALENRPNELYRRVGAAALRWILAEAQQRPLLITLDDLQFASEGALELFMPFFRAESRIAWIASGDRAVGRKLREAVPNADVQIASLEPLHERQINSLVRTLLPNLKSIPETLIAALTHRSQGNPSAVRDLVFGLKERGVFTETPEGLVFDVHSLESGSLPVSMDDAIRARLQQLDAMERAALERAAIVGDTFWSAPILSQMRTEENLVPERADAADLWPSEEHDAKALEAALDRLEQKGHITSVARSDFAGTREYRFLQSRMRAQLYEMQRNEVRAIRHGAVASWFSSFLEARDAGTLALSAQHYELAGRPIAAARSYIDAAVEERNRLRTTPALEYVERAVAIIPDDETSLRMEALHARGALLTILGRYEEALQAFTEMLQIAWRLGALGRGGAAFNRIARVYRHRGEESRARMYLDRALELFRAAGDMRGVAATLDDIAQIARLRGNLNDAIEAASEGLKIRHSLRDRRGEAVSLTTVGSIELARGNLDGADSMFRKALEIRQAIGDQEGTTDSFSSLGTVAHERGDRNSAIGSWKTALDRAHEIGDRRSECHLLNRLGEALLSAGQLLEATQSLQEARDLAGSLGDQRALVEIQRNLGLLALRKGEEDAERLLLQALTLAEKYGAKETLALCHRAVGELRARTVFDTGSKMQRRAEESFLISIDVFREIGSEKEVARSLTELGFHLIERGDYESAKERLHEARSIMRRIGLAGLERVERTLTELG